MANTTDTPSPPRAILPRQYRSGQWVLRHGDIYQASAPKDSPNSQANADKPEDQSGR